MNAPHQTAWGVISDLVRSTLGISIGHESSSGTQRRIAALLSGLGYDSLEAAADRIRSAGFPPEHLASLVPAVAIGETWFYRDEIALEELRRRLIPELVSRRRKQGRTRLRVWSAACASGAEPYTLAMLLAEAVPSRSGWDVSVLGTDVNAETIETALAGRYPKRLLRTLPQDLARRYFRDEDNAAILADAVRSAVTFRRLNLMSDALPETLGGYDIIYCANVLIYFEPDRAVALLERMKSCLAPDGILVVSAVEAPIASLAGYVRESQPICQIVRVPQTRLRLEPSRRSASPGTRRARVRAAPRSQPESEAEPVRRDTAQSGYVARIAELLTRGKLEAAQALAAQALGESPLDASIYVVSALVHEEIGDTFAAKECLRRAIYLDPANTMAHVYLGNLLSLEGDGVAAERQFRAASESLRDSTVDGSLDPIHQLPRDEIKSVVSAALERRNHGR